MAYSSRCSRDEERPKRDWDVVVLFEKRAVRWETVCEAANAIRWSVYSVCVHNDASYQQTSYQMQLEFRSEDAVTDRTLS